MADIATIARPYAQAAFAQAMEESRLKQWSKMLEILSIAVSDPRMRSLINSPRTGRERLLQLTLDICGTGLSKTEQNFIRVLIDAKRLAVAAEIFSLFRDKRDAAEGIAEINVITAYPLADDQRIKISEALAEKLNRTIEVVSEVDKSLIGGAVIRAGDSVIDASIKGRLQELNNIFSS